LRWEDAVKLTQIIPEYSILLGLANAGKTTLLSQIKALFMLHPDGDAEPSSTASNTMPTVGQKNALGKGTNQILVLSSAADLLLVGLRTDQHQRTADHG
jgi:hypothetical protein